MSRILFVITQSEIGGAQRFLLEFAPYLASRGHKIAIAAGEGDGALFEQLVSSIKYQVLSIYRVQNLVRNLNPLKDIGAIFSIFKIINKEKPDIVFLQSTKAGFLGSLAVRLYKILNTKCQIRVVYRIGGWSFRDPRSWWMNKILFWMEKVSAPLKDKIIVNSELDRRLAIDKKIAQPDKIIRVYNGIDPRTLHFLPKEEARRFLESRIDNLEFSSGNIVIGTIANLYATKGVEYFVKAARSLSDVQFVVIGEGKEHEKLEYIIKNIV